MSTCNIVSLILVLKLSTSLHFAVPPKFRRRSADDLPTVCRHSADIPPSRQLATLVSFFSEQTLWPHFYRTLSQSLPGISLGVWYIESYINIAIVGKSLVLLPTPRPSTVQISVCHKTVSRMPLKTTVIGAWPKPDYLKLGDWFQSGQSKLDFK
jgi:hypothetical protein